MGNTKQKGRISARRAATFLAALGALVMSSGVALMVTTTSANAADCTPKAAYTETTDWVDQSPGAGWYQVDSQIKTPATDAHWADLMWHTYTGNEPDADNPPALNDPNWHAVPAGPQSAVHAIPPRVPNVPYNVSNNDNGNGSWFLWTGTWVPATDAVLEYKFSLDHPAVTCEGPLVATATATPNTPTCADTVPSYTKSGANIESTWQESAAPAFNTTITVTATAVSGAEFAGGDTTKSIQVTFPAAASGCTQVSPVQTLTEATVVVSPPKAKAKAKTKTKAAAVTPTVVEAGLAGTSTKDLRGEQGLALMVAGMVMLVGAGGLRLRVRGVASRI